MTAPNSPESSDDLTILPPCHEALHVLYQDDSIMVVSKPTRLLTVPGRHPLNNDSVITRLQVDYPAISAVHRLDFDTSGILVVPLTKAALSHISKQFQARTVRKHYIAVVGGLMAMDEGEIDLPIARADGPLYHIDHQAGKPSLTRYRVLSRDAAVNQTRVLLEPITGRSHQLRLHLQAIGHPILGCDFYGGAYASTASRLLLHARDITFMHPTTGQSVTFEREPDF